MSLDTRTASEVGASLRGAVKATIRYEDGPLAGEDIPTVLPGHRKVGDRIVACITGHTYVVVSVEPRDNKYRLELP